jgi:hypothetical protein
MADVATKSTPAAEEKDGARGNEHPEGSAERRDRESAAVLSGHAGTRIFES